MVKNIEAVLFDFDGVLVNSLPIMEQCWQEVRDNLDSVRNIPFGRYKENIGRQFSDIMNRLGISIEDGMKASEIYFSSDFRNQTPELYGGVIDMFELLDKVNKKAIVTSKDRETSLRWLRQLKLDSYISDLQTPDGLYGLGKPNPYLLLRSLDKMNVHPDNAIYVGDMEVDYDAAQRAGIRFVHAGWGYGKIVDSSYIQSFDSPRELFKFLNECNI